MASSWTQLSEPWQLAFEQAIVAYLERDSVPIGALIVDGEGAVVARAGNDFSSGRLAHAELNALNALPKDVARSQCEIYSTLEPCPMCTGAIRMSQLRGVHFAARDPSAGSTELLTVNGFMREFPCNVHEPNHSDLETVIVSLLMEYRLRTGHTRWLNQWRDYHLLGACQGLRLFESSAHANWVAAGANAEVVYQDVVAMRKTILQKLPPIRL